MLKTVTTLFRGAVAAAEEDLADRNALAFLAQQIRDAAAGIDQGKGSLVLGMAVVMLVQTCITVTKTVRDVHEGRRLVNRIEDAKTERLLMGVDHGRG